MKKQFIGTLALLITFGLASCSSTAAKSDETACKTVLKGMSDFKASHKTPPKNMTNPAEALAMLKPVAKIMDKASEQAKTEKLADSLEELGDVLEKGGSASLADMVGLQKHVINIDTTCKTAGVDLSAALKK